MAATPLRPTDSYPIELHYIKALCLQKQYRQCIHACRNHLKHSSMTAEKRLFVNFYLGLAHDELGRAMHDYSPAKLPALNQAEQFYNEALESLPEAEERLKSKPKEVVLPLDDPFIYAPGQLPGASTSDQFEHDQYYQFATPPVSPSKHSHTDSLPQRSPPLAASRETSSSTLTSLESHSSFDQIMTPHKILQRDMSKMSLLDESPPRRPAGLPRTTSSISQGPLQQQVSGMKLSGRALTSQGLMKPVRMGSPARPYQAPPRLPNAGDRSSRLPRLTTRNLETMSPPRRHVLDAAGVSPVSPLGSERSEFGMSDASTISPVSPTTPIRAEDSLPRLPEQQDKKQDEAEYEPPVPDALNEGTKAMRFQIQYHIVAIEKVRQETLAKRAARAADRASASTTGASLAPGGKGRSSMDSTKYSGSRPGSSSSSKHDSVTGAEMKRLPQLRSFWALTWEDFKADEKKKRIQERIQDGRERKWAKERFRPEKYRELAEKALAEL
jgi:hypothetical protein